jgi:acetyl-CoA carboxylase carboxyltransferase component
MLTPHRELVDKDSPRGEEALRQGDHHRLRPHRRPARGHRGQPALLQGRRVLFVDSADKAARFIWLCDAFNIPLLYLADVPGFMIGTKVEQQGIIRAGAKMIAAVSEAARAEALSVVVRKAYGAGLYAMCGPAFEPDVCLALPTARSP